MSSAFYALRLPHNAALATTHVFRVIVTPRTDHGGDVSHYFRVRIARAVEMTALEGGSRPSWKESLRLLRRMQENSSHSIAAIVLECPPLDVQILPLRCSDLLTAVDNAIEWGDLLTEVL